ncbi:siderophore-interacting protein [Leminorella grimontii]|uniref:siderophore-interacting protein n=1 Tax=Leminorella grimontii TaxID=82981 RepID=UPI0032209A22
MSSRPINSCPPKRAEGQRELCVIDAYALNDGFRRVILGGAELETLTVDRSIIGPHLKLIIPPKDAAYLLWPEFDPKLGRLVWPEGERPTVRTYSLRHYDKENQRLTIDLVSHEGGVASDWARCAKAGDKIGIWGPGGRIAYRGQWTLFVADRSALPAVAYSLEEVLPRDAKGKAVIEVAGESEIMALNSPKGIEVVWLIRRDGDESALIDAAASTAFPAGAEPLVWGGMECSSAKALRRSLIDKGELARDQIYLVNYWREGVPEGGFSHTGED